MEADPDPYIIVLPAVEGVPGHVRAYAAKNYGTSSSPNWGSHANVTTRDFAFTNCLVNATCWLAGGITILPSSSANSEISLVWGALDAAEVTLEAFAGAVEGAGTSIQLQIDNYLDWPSAERCPSACAPGPNLLRMPLDQGVDNSVSPPVVWRNTAVDALTPPHEIGHAIHYREMGLTAFPSAGCPWSVDAPLATDSCATIEGFAVYATAVGWYDPTDALAAPWYGIGLETATPLETGSCSDNRHIAGQVAKGFWDLDDGVNEAAIAPATVADETSHSTLAILNLWENFAPGTANRMASETGGFNMWDYVWNAWNDGNGGWGPAAKRNTLMLHNCLGSQTGGP